jgi:hypothetical protein
MTMSLPAIVCCLCCTAGTVTILDTYRPPVEGLTRTSMYIQGYTLDDWHARINKLSLQQTPVWTRA